MTGQIIGTGACVPEKVINNQELEGLVETSDAWIQERTGIERRHIAVKETTVSMAAKAASEALKEAELPPEQIDLILVSTMSPEEIMPCTACQVQREIGASRAVCFDLSAACSGFVMAYVTACAYIEAGIFQNILVIGSECLSNVTDWSDRGTCILFGDGAGAAVLTAAEETKYLPSIYSDGSRGGALTLKSRQNHNPFGKEAPAGDEGTSYYIEMDGQAIFKFAVRSIPQAVEEVLRKNHLHKSDIRYYVLHQANERIVEAVAKRLGEPAYKFPMNMKEYGNTSSASIPLLIHEMKEKNMLHSGDRLVLAGFGGGLTWGTAIITWK